jgi:hypothetical protein
MDSRTYCAYNLSQDAVLSRKITVADASRLPLTVMEALVDRIANDPESGLWLTSLSYAPGLPRPFACDLVYLDQHLLVVKMVELAPGVGFPAWSERFASALILPARTLASTKTSPGDRFTFCDLRTMEALRKRLSTPVGVQSGFKPIEQGNSPNAPSISDAQPPDDVFQESSEEEEEAEDQAYPSHRVLFAAAATPIAVGHASQFTFAKWPMWPASTPTAAAPGSGRTATSAANVQTNLAATEITGVPIEAQPEPSAPTPQAGDSTNRAATTEPVPVQSAIPGPAAETATPSSPPPISAGFHAEPEIREGDVPEDPEAPRFYFPKRVRFFDPLSETPEDKLPANGDSGAGQSNRLSPALQAVILQLTEQQKQREKDSLGKRAKTQSENPKAEAAVPLPPELQEARTFPAPSPSPVAQFRPWLDADEPVGPFDRRVSTRLHSPGLVAYYFSGGPPRPEPVADISATGFYLRTNESWVPHTLVRMTLQSTEQGRMGKPRLTLAILARVVRIDSKGVGHEYVLSESLNRNGRDILPDKGTDRQALKQFLELLRNGTGAALAS